MTVLHTLQQVEHYLDCQAKKRENIVHPKKRSVRSLNTGAVLVPLNAQFKQGWLQTWGFLICIFVYLYRSGGH